MAATATAVTAQVAIATAVTAQVALVPKVALVVETFRRAQIVQLRATNVQRPVPTLQPALSTAVFALATRPETKRHKPEFTRVV
ncbi:MAG: hypothetical protein CMH52_13175 [Myxococcales bacterium]|nr:hypothetical protein [Myxococcales bacterium]